MPTVKIAKSPKSAAQYEAEDRAEVYHTQSQRLAENAERERSLAVDLEAARVEEVTITLTKAEAKELRHFLGSINSNVFHHFIADTIPREVADAKETNDA